MLLHIGCGRDIKPGWVNLDSQEYPGVDVVADLNQCPGLPFKTNSVDRFEGSHVLEHIQNILPLMEELWHIAKPGAKAVFRVPYGSSDEAVEDPTHVRQMYLHSFSYFSQPAYWRADYGYRGDWRVTKATLLVARERYEGVQANEILNDIHTLRNIVIEMEVEMEAVKPARGPDKGLQVPFDIHIQLHPPKGSE